jgi:hypothetical protein
MFAQPAFASLVVALVLGALAAAWIASRLAFPGRAVSHGGSRLLAMFPVLLAAAVLVAAPWGGHWQSWARMSVESAGCIAVVVMTAALPWGATLYLMGRLAPLNELRAAMFTGLSALFVGSLVVQLHCPANSSYHLAFAHLLPVLVVSLLSCLAAVAVLRAGRSLQSP